MLTRLLRTKPVEEILREAHTGVELKRTLGPVHLIMLGIGAIIGAGIFVLTGTAAAEHAGPSIILSFVLAGTACALAGLCYSEFASMIPVSGSAYTYAYATMGEFFAWIIGWDLILEYSFAASTVSIGWAGYFVEIFQSMGIELPTSLTGSPWSEPAGVFNVPAAAICLILTVVLIIGIKESANFNAAIVFIKVGVVLLFLAAAVGYVKTSNWKPFMPFGVDGMATGAAVIFFAYIGFDAVSTTAQEARNPQRDMPIGILGSLAICTVLYLAVAAVMTGVVYYTELAVPAPIALAIRTLNMPWLSAFISLGAIAGITSVILVMLLGQPRIFYIMAKDGLLPAFAAKVHPRYRTPHVTTAITGTACALVAGLTPINQLGHLVSIGTLLAFTLVCGGVLVLRYTRPDLPRPFKVPGFPMVPLLGMAACLYLMASLPTVTWLRLAIWMVVGLVIYFTYGYRNSHLNRRFAERTVEVKGASEEEAV
ncbi:MAG: amino acid permease [Acidobacteriota bacterium]